MPEITTFRIREKVEVSDFSAHLYLEFEIKQGYQLAISLSYGGSVTLSPALALPTTFEELESYLLAECEKLQPLTERQKGDLVSEVLETVAALNEKKFEIILPEIIAPFD